MLYHSHLCATRGIDRRWLEGDNLPRVHAASLTRATFQDCFERPNLPVVLTGCKEFALASKKWDREYLREALKGRDIIAGVLFLHEYDMRLLVDTCMLVRTVIFGTLRCITGKDAR